MLPTLPLGVLVPLALGTCALLLALVVGMFLRRVLLHWWSKGGARGVGRAEARLREARASQAGEEAAVRWISHGGPARIRAFVAAAKALEAADPEWSAWLRGSTIPAALAHVAAPTDGRAPGRWKRVAALVAIGELRLGEHEALVRALDDRDPDVAYVAAESLGRLDTPQGARAILQRIGGQTRLLDSRLASVVEAMTCEVGEVLREALRSKSPTIVYWALALAGRKRLSELCDAVRPHLASESANVRAAACECVGELRLPDTDRWLAPLLRDDVWYVQCHAAKALGAMTSEWAVDEIANLLYSPHWWVRQNATQALSDLGSASEPLAEKVLRSDDRYARACAVEVLSHLGWAENTIMRVHRGRNAREVELLERFGRSGGLGYLENALWGVPQAAVPTLLALLEKIGDGASYGRIRAARARLSPELQELALATAERLRAR